MAENEYQELIAFIGEKFERVDRRFEMMEGRFRETDDKIEEARRHMGVLVEAVRDDVRQLAEGLAGTNQRLDRVQDQLGGMEQRFDRFEQKVEAEFAETRAAIRFSYAQLERRLQELEGNYVALNERVARLEAAQA
jgi:predicted nuclease with TOPRIM domain